MYQKKIKADNEKKIFHYIYKEKKDFCIADIGKALDMSFPTVKNVLFKLLENGIIKESSKISSGNGRRAQGYSLNKNFCYSIGIRINISGFNFVLLNEKGSIVKELSIVEELDKNNLIYRLDEELEEFLDSISKEVQEKILGIGIAIPGVTDDSEDILEITTNFKISQEHIRKLSKKYNLKIIVDNESNLSAIAEKFLGIGERLNYFLTLDIGETISMANFKEEGSYGNFSSRASRVEHLCIEIDGRPCDCSHKGCWGSYISERALLRSFKEVYPNISRYQDIFKDEYLNTDIGKKLLKDYIRYLAIGIKNLIFMYNPEKIIISGNICKHSELIKESLLDYIYDNHIFFRGRDTITFSRFKEKSSTLGAGIMPIVDSLF